MFAAAVASSLFVVSACYPDRLDNVNYDVVATVHDSTANFKATTFALDDSVVHLLVSGSDNISRAYDAQILARIRSNMTARGYTEVADPNTADLAMLVGVTTADYTAYYWDYWCGSWGYWWGYGCYYPPYYGTYTYTLGTLFVGMQDRRTLTGGKVETIWLGIGNGLVGQGVTATRVTGAIDQMFTQSPFIKAN